VSEPPLSRTYTIRTFGCQMNEHDSGRAAGMLETLGYRRALDEASADLVLLNTCAVRENADNRLYGTLGHLKSLKDQRRADGERPHHRRRWLPRAEGRRDGRREGPVGRRRLRHPQPPRPPAAARPGRLGRGPVVELVEQLETFPSALPAKREVRHHAWVSISVGCNNACTFCIVPSLRGPERSRRIGEIVEEVESLVADDVIEVTLLGQNVNSYGRDLAGASQFAELLRELGTVAGLERVRFTSPHPRDFTEAVLHAMAETPNVCPHLHLPLQSGSDRVLRLMRRSYRSRRYLRLVERTRELLPDAALTTDLIVGFPGETDEDFQATLDVVAEVGFDQAFTFQYSPRPGTPAAALVDEFVPPEVVKERYGRLETLVRQQSLVAHQRLVGTEQELLVESPSKTDATRWSGRTRGNHLVHLPAPDDGRWRRTRLRPRRPRGRSDHRGSDNYNLAGEVTSIRRTSAGRAAGAAMARGEGHRRPLDAPITPGAGARQLPVLTTIPAAGP
jgi:tRNA-2-methylthio-N6-dimethylallyladenosine synthase